MILIINICLNCLLFITTVYFYNKKNNNDKYNSDLKEENEKLDEDYKNTLKENGNLKGNYDSLVDKINEIKEENFNLKAKIENLQQDNNELKVYNGTLEEKNSKYLSELDEKKDYYEIKQNNELLKQKLEQESKQKDEYYKKINENIEDKFKNISNEIIKQQRSDFTEQQKNVLDPFKEQLNAFKISIDNINKTNIENKTSLEEQIKNLSINNENLQKEARDLTIALKGEKKTQGNWGEFQLERLLEISGLKEGVDYSKQETTISEDGEIHRPDFIINLPDNKRVIVDSKVSLNNYLNYVNSEDKKDKENFLKEYIKDLKNHIKELGDKKYQKELKSQSLDYVFMFVPLERAYIDAIDNCIDNTDIFKYAYDNNVAIATPSSLIPVLRIIKHLWSIETQNKKTEKIVELGKNIYEKLYNFQEKMKNIGENIKKLGNTYSESYKYLYTGNANVFKSAENLKSCGINTTKNLKLDMDNNYNDDDSEKIDE